MSVTLEELEKRVVLLEKEVALWRKQSALPLPDSIAERGAWRMRESLNSQSVISATIARVFKEMGITGPPPGITTLRAMMREAGVKPEDKILSSEILAMREE